MRARLARTSGVLFRLSPVCFLLACGIASLSASQEEAFSLLRGGEYEKAAESLRAALEKAPQDAAIRRGLAEAHAARGEYEAALAVLEASESFGKTVALLDAAGRIHLRTGKLAEAEAAFRESLKADPRGAEALNRLGEVLHQTGRKQEAERTWRRLVGVYQDLTQEEAEALPADAFVEMGVALVRLNRFHDANDVMFPQAEEQDPKCPSLFLEWGRVFMEKYNYPDSRTLFRDAIDQNPAFADARVAMALNYLADFQVGTRRYELADRQIEKALEVNPLHAGAYSARGQLWLSDGNLPQARADFERALEIRPTDQETLGLLAACLHLTGEEEEFSRVEARALEINPMAAEFYHTIAQAIEKRFRYADAIAMSEKAITKDPEYWPVYHTIGINCLRTGQEQRGREYLQKSYDRDPFNVWVVNTRKLLRHMDGNHQPLQTERIHYSFPRADYEILRSYLVPFLDEAYTTLSARYGVTLEPPVHIDVFSSHQWFSARIAGLGGFPATGACFGNVVALTTPKALPQNWGVVAWHEFAHVVTLHATAHRIPRWLTEGISVYEEGRERPRWARNFRREIADAYGSRRLLPLNELDFGFSKPKYPGQVLISYYQGCLIVQYISKRWGFDKIPEILEGYRENRSTPAIFKKCLDVTIEEFDRGFFEFVDAWVKETGYQPEIGEERMHELEREVEANPDDIAALVDLAWAYYCQQNDIDSPLTAQKVLQRQPDNGDALAIIGFNQLRDKKTAEARESLAKALEKGTRFRFRAHAALGRLDASDNKIDEAIEHLEQAKRVSPIAGAGHPPRGNVYHQLADLYRKKGEEAKAIEQFEQLREFAVQDPACRMQLVKHYLTEGTDESLRKVFEILDELIFINPFDREVHERLASVSERIGEHRTVIREQRLILTLPGADAKQAYLAMARAHQSLGEKEEAARCAEKVLEIDSENEEARKIRDATGA
ncbi:MAG: tetratricopeptide repeat protein [Planctomycetes bacterium]|nr:tetratricopeptide repeat protein [Planctomycetota bacterium]